VSSSGSSTSSNAAPPDATAFHLDHAITLHDRVTDPTARTAPPSSRPTAEELIGRARDLRPRLLDRQEEAEQLSYYPASTHEDLQAAGVYRTLQPRRFGGWEHDVPTFCQVIIELSRGCPSTGWCVCLCSAHALQVASLFEERAQAEAFGPDGDFRAASFASPMGAAVRDGDGYRLDGTWPYSSGAPYSTHFLGQTVLSPQDQDGPPGPVLLFIVPRAQWELVDDWHGVLGLRGSGSHSVRIADQRVPAHHVIECLMVDVDVSAGTPGSRLHGNPMYAGRTLGFFTLELVSVTVGAAYAALDEYERIITTRPSAWVPSVKRFELAEYQRQLGAAVGKIAAAEAAVNGLAREFMELCRRNIEDGVPFTQKDDYRLVVAALECGRLAWHTVEGILFHTGGSAGARDGQRLQRYFRDMATYWSHNTPAQEDVLAERLGRLHLGLPLPPFGEPPPIGA
jgi:3-hydroxy-9,10-secoandrosta-1,3,5(10)-triene-9,17-dione monooxygenase